MTIAGSRVYTIPTFVGIGPDDWRLDDVLGSASTTTKADFGTGTTQRWIQLYPGTSRTVQYSTTIPGTTATAVGWNVPIAEMSVPIGDDAEGTGKRRILAGTWTFHHSWAATQADVTGQYALFSRLYRRTTGGAFVHVGSIDAANTGATGTDLVQSGDVTASLAEMIFAPGETLHIEIFMKGKGLAIVGQVITLQIASSGTNTNYFDLPAAFAKQVFRPMTAETLAATDALGRKLFMPRNMPETVQGTDLTTPVARATKVGRAISEAAPTTDAIGRMYRAARPLAENIPIGADATARKFVGGRANAETLPTTSTLAMAFKGQRSIAETIPTVDQVGRKFAGKRALDAETYPTADSVPDRVYRAVRPLAAETHATTHTVPERKFMGGRNNSEPIPTIDALGRFIKQRRFLEEYPTGVTPDYAVTFPTRHITGIVKDNNGAPVAGATVKLYRDQDDVAVQTTASAGDGSYQFLRDMFDPYTYYVGAYEEVGDKTGGITERGLTPTDI